MVGPVSAFNISIPARSTGAKPYLHLGVVLQAHAHNVGADRAHVGDAGSSFGTGRISTCGMGNERSGVVRENHDEQVAIGAGREQQRCPERETGNHRTLRFADLCQFAC